MQLLAVSLRLLHFFFIVGVHILSNRDGRLLVCDELFEKLVLDIRCRVRARTHHSDLSAQSVAIQRAPIRHVVLLAAHRSRFVLARVHRGHLRVVPHSIVARMAQTLLGQL